MTGLNVEKEEIMEAAVIVTDSELNLVAEGPNLILKVDDKILDNMNNWCKEHHGKVPLTYFSFTLKLYCSFSFAFCIALYCTSQIHVTSSFVCLYEHWQISAYVLFVSFEQIL